MSARSISIAAVFLTLALGCSGTRSSSYRTAGGGSQRYEGAVRVFAVAAPPEAREVGIVQVDSVEELARAVIEFQNRVADLGGDVGLIDRYTTSFEIVSSTSQQSYSCGTQQSPQTCTRQVTQQREVATLHLIGRAMITRSHP